MKGSTFDKNKENRLTSMIASWIKNNSVFASLFGVVAICFILSAFLTTCVAIWAKITYDWWDICAIQMTFTFLTSLLFFFPKVMISAIISSIFSFFALRGWGTNSSIRYLIVIVAALLFVLLILCLKKIWPRRWAVYANNQRSEFKQVFDRLISQGHSQQLKWLVGVLLSIYLLMASIMGAINAFGLFPKLEKVHWNPLSLTYMLLTDSSTLGSILQSGSHVGIFIALLCVGISLLGALLFTGLLISVFSNFLQRRSEDYLKGHLHYSLKDHVVFLGYDETLPYIVQQVSGRKENRNRKFLIQTHIPSEDVRQEFKTVFRNSNNLQNIIFCNGRRNSKIDLAELCISTASEIFIIGNRENDNHDELNLTCLRNIQEILSEKSCERKKITIMLEDHTRYMKLKDILGDDHSIVKAHNFYADWANIIFNRNCDIADSDKEIPKYPSLIPAGTSNKESVNIIINGMTRFGVALGIEAIQRLPDMFVQDTPINSVITFICKNAFEEMSLFKSRYEELFKYIDCSYMNLDNDDKKGYNVNNTIYNANGKSLFTMEFIEGDLFSSHVRELLKIRNEDDNIRLSIFSCIGKDTTDLNSGLYLPFIVQKKANVFILQRYGQETLKSIVTDSQQIYPFGMNQYPWYGVEEYITGSNSSLMSRTQRRQGNYQKALEFIERSEALTRVFYSPNSYEIINKLITKSYILEKLGKNTNSIMDVVFPILEGMIKQNNPKAQFEMGDCYYFGIGVGPDYNKAVEYYTSAVKQGHVKAQYSLGVCYEEGRGVEQDYKKAVDYYSLAAQQGDVNAQLSMGVCYYWGRGVEEDETKAVKFFSQAAQQGDVNAQFNLGICYYYGRGVEQDYKKAVEYYTLATQKGNVSAQYFLGVCYENGQGVEQDYKKAVEYYSLAAQQGDVDAQYHLGLCYEDGVGVKQDYKKAIEYYSQAAQQGNVDAQFNLGVCYYYGRGVEQDYKKAVEYYFQAAQQDNVDAQFNMGICYYYGRGVEQDFTKAVKFFSQAAQQGDVNAQFNLGICYYYGRGVEQDYKKAVEYYTLAAQKSDAKAQENLGECYYFGDGVEKDTFEAVKWWEKAAGQNDAAAQFWLGFCHLYGQGGLQQSEGNALDWFLLSAQQSFSEAQFELGNIYKQGMRGIPKDYKRAVEWYKKAAHQGNSEAQYALAICYAYGQGIEQDDKKAFELYSLSADQNNHKALYALGVCYEEGRGVEVDLKKAEECYKKSIELGNEDANENLEELLNRMK